jgi:hypothetical protein
LVRDMAEPEKNERKDANLHVLLNFLQLTKEGKYTSVEPDTSRYPMIEEGTFDDSDEEYYFFGMY